MSKHTAPTPRDRAAGTKKKRLGAVNLPDLLDMPAEEVEDIVLRLFDSGRLAMTLDLSEPQGLCVLSMIVQHPNRRDPDYAGQLKSILAEMQRAMTEQQASARG